LTSFGSGFIVQPNAIDFAFVFSNADFLSNPTLYITEIVIAVLYIMLFLWARRQDKKDLLKVTFLISLVTVASFVFHLVSTNSQTIVTELYYNSYDVNDINTLPTSVFVL